MKCAFSFNGCHYIAPSKKEAKRFIKFFGDRGAVYRLRTNWRIRFVERAPSYCQIMKIFHDHVEFEDIEFDDFYETYL